MGGISSEQYGRGMRAALKIIPIRGKDLIEKGFKVQIDKPFTPLVLGIDKSVRTK